MLKSYPFSGVIFDLDGVITQTALVHSAAWKKMFDEFLLEWSRRHGLPFREFDHQADYLPYVDGKPRYQGVASFLSSRGIELPYGTPDDSPEMETICGLGNRKNNAFNEVLERDGVKVYQSTINLIYELRKNDIRVAVASSSKNCEQVLRRAGILNLFEARVDGVVSAQLGLKGKPEPDIFTTATVQMGLPVHRCVVVEDAVSGVQAGKAGNFGMVLGIARENNHHELLINGADVVVCDLAELGGIEGIEDWFTQGLPHDNFSLTYYDFIPGKEKHRETLLTVGNGYFATRGAIEETNAGGPHYPATYMAGLYNRLISKVADRDVENEDFVNAVNWLPITFKLGEGPWFDPNKHEVLEIKRSLNFKNGLLERHMLVNYEGHRVKVVSSRFVSMQNPHLAAQRYTVIPEDYEGQLTIRGGIDGNLINDGVERYKALNQHHLKMNDQYAGHAMGYVVNRTVQSRITIATAYQLECNFEATLFPEVSEGKSFISFSGQASKGTEMTLVKKVAICNSLTSDHPLQKAQEQLTGAPTFDEMLSLSEAAWGRIWMKADIQLEGDRLAQKIFRMHLYHLFVTTSVHNVNLDFGIPARGLHGEAYRGHIFWDELYILPIYYYNFPGVARSILMYRYRRLPAAREYARQRGFRGAMFPWQSGSSGCEETQVVHLNPVSGKWGDDYSSLQRHVSLAIAYNVWEYFHATHDKEFLIQFGAELFFDICLFWTGLAQKNPETGRYHISGVMGPDEFHEKYPNSDKGGLRDNAYSNLMTAWALRTAYKIREIIGEEEFARITQIIGLEEQEWMRWHDISRNLNLCINSEGIIAQYDGYFELKELDWDYFRKKYGNVYRMDRLLKAEGFSPDEYKVAKQADTLMIFYNLYPQEVTSLLQEMGYSLPEDYILRNLKYYLERTSHGSTLSRIVHAKLARMVGEDQLGWQLYREALTSDYIDIQGGTTAEGIHAGVMAGTLWIALSVYAGLDLRGEIPAFHPALPEHWERLQFSFLYRNVRYHVNLNHHTLEITAASPTTEKLPILVRQQKVWLEPGLPLIHEI